MGTILLIILVLVLIGALPTWPYSSGWGYYPSGGLGLILLIVVILLVMGPDMSAPIKKGKKEYKMNRGLTLSSVVLLAALLVSSGCTSMTGQTAGQYVDDTTITTSVKAKLVGDKTANLTRIEVDTTNQVVTLNGIVESADQKAKAEQLARQVGGVKSVKNNLQVQKQS